MSKVILLLGSNLGDRKDFLKKAIELIDAEVGLVLKLSSIYESEPWGFTSDEMFLNQVIIINSNDKPQTLLKKLQKIEKELGRKIKSSTYQSRTIDIDILFYDKIKLKTKELTIPHPQLHLRKFTMDPLIEIAGDYIHPVFGERVDLLIKNDDRNESVKVFEYSETPLTLSSNEL